MGEVYLASSPGGRKVAVKVIRAEYVHDPLFRTRFAREIDAARRIGGFHTAQIVDADTGADPPWMASAYIPGPSLEELVRTDGPLGLPQARALGAALAEGLAAIHACGVVHRDLKPGNVIMAEDGPRIIDFGIAQVVDASTLTPAGVAIGSFSFMSPEQVHAQSVSPASDVFALGAVLAFAVNGRSPFEADTIPAIVSRIVYGEPDLESIDDDLRVTILACLAKRPEDRPSAADVLVRLGAVPGTADHAGLLVPSTRQDAFTPRPETEPSARGVATLAPPASVPPPRSADLQPEESGTGARRQGVPRRALLIGVLASAAVAGSGTAVALLVPGSSPSDVSSGTGTKLTSFRSNGTSTNATAFSPDGKLLAAGCSTSTSGSSVNAGFAQLWNVSSGASAATVPGQGNVVSVAFSPDGRQMAIGSDLGYLQLWDVAAGGITATYNMAGQDVGGAVASIAFSPDGTTLAAGTDDGNCDGVVQFWKLPDGKSTYHSVNGADCRSNAGITTVVFRGKGTVISGGVDGAIRVWDVSSGKNTATWSAGGPVAALALSPDGKMLVSGGQAAGSGLVRFWDLPSGTSRHATSKGRILSIAWSPDGKHVVSGGQDEMVRVWDVATCTNTSSFAVPCTYGVASVAFQPDSTTYAVSGAVGAGAMIWVRQLD